MSDTTGSVLNFTRDAAFINRRARARHNSGEYIEALKLFRRACAEAPDNVTYQADLAEMLYTMGCVDASYHEVNRLMNKCAITSGALRNQPSLRRALFLQARNLRNMGYPHAAQIMLRPLKDMRMGKDAELFNNLYEQVVARTILSYSKQPRMRFLERILHFISANDILNAYIAARRYLVRHKASPLGHIALAWALNGMKEQAESTEHMVRALTTMQRDPWVLYIASIILSDSDPAQAQQLLVNAFALTDDRKYDLFLLRQAAALNIDSLVMDIAARILEHDPGAPYPSACRAVAQFNTGASVRAAMMPLSRSLDIYPGDIIASHYAELLEAAPQAALAYPDAEMLMLWSGNAAKLSANIMNGKGGLASLSDRETKLMAWGLYHSSMQTCVTSATILLCLGGEQACSELWKYLVSQDAPDKMRMTVLYMMVMANMPLPKLIFMRGKLMSLNKELMCRISALLEPRLSLRKAARRLRDEPSAITDMHKVLNSCGDMGLNEDELASALECTIRILKGEAISLRAVANRRSINCARLTRAVYSYLQIAGHQEEQP